jgi:hypothetical protein
MAQMRDTPLIRRLAAGARRRPATVLAILRRQWKISVPVLVVTVLAVVALEAVREPEYQAPGSLLLAAPEVDPSFASNRAANLRRTLDRLERPSTQAEIGLEDEALETSLLDATGADIAVRARESREAQQLLQRTLSWIDEDVWARQAEANIDDAERVRVLTREHPPTRESDGGATAAATVWFEDPSSIAYNPYDASVSTLRLLEIAATSHRGEQELRERLGEGVEVGVTVNLRDLAPMISVTTFGHDPDRTLAGFGEVEAFLKEELEARQARAQVPASLRLWLDPVSQPLEAHRDGRLLGPWSMATILLGIVLSTTLAALADWRARVSRRGRPSPPTHRGRSDAAPPGAPAPRSEARKVAASSPPRKASGGRPRTAPARVEVASRRTGRDHSARMHTDTSCSSPSRKMRS